MVTSQRSRDPKGARRRILDAAAAEFAARGFAGARVDRLARAAGVNKRMLYHYFGDKRGLHRAVLDACWPRRGGDPGRRPTRRDAAAVRLLLWALLEPETADEARARVPGGQTDPVAALAAYWLDGVPASAMPPATLPVKPRVRLRHAAARR